jgi:hypothetical protein
MGPSRDRLGIDAPFGVGSIDMITWIVDWWTGLAWKLRAGVALGFLLLSTVIFFCGSFWVWGWAIGVALLLFSFPSEAEKRGYHDF